MTRPRLRVGVHEAKTQLSTLLRLVAAGQEIEILRNGEPVARLGAAVPRAVRQFGTDRGRFDVPEDFDARWNPTCWPCASPTCPTITTTPSIG